MSYQALARKWRPRTFAEVIGQDHVVSALRNALASERVHHAYLFTGTRGVGKTTLARIFARALNCENGVGAEPCGECAACVGISQGNYIDLIEVDAASRTKVDDTRELLENVQYAPTVGRFKIYLIDEVHMLSTHSFNALLKTLEEPPAHVKFLLATTDPQKLPATILSRCIQFNLKSLDIPMLRDHLGGILDAESVPFDAEALSVLARSADGSVRDALSLTDQAIAHGNGEVRAEPVRAMLGMIDDRFALELLEAVCQRDGAAVLSTVSAMAERAVNFRAALDDVLSSLHNAALHHVDPVALDWKGVDSESAARVAELADPELLQLLYQVALLGKRDLPLAPDGRTGFEMALLRMALFQPQASEGAGSAVPPTAVRGGAPAGSTSRQKAGDRRPVAVAPATNTDAKPYPVAEEPGLDTARKSVADTTPRDANPGAAENGRKPRGDAPVNGAVQAEVPDWNGFVASQGLNGLARELVMNMVADGFEGGTLQLVLDATSRHLFSDDRLKRIERQCSRHFGRELRLAVTIRELEGEAVETPAMQRERERIQRQKNAEKAFQEDPNVRELMDRFDARIVPDSIRPGTD